MILTYWYFTSTLVCFTPNLCETRSNALLKRLLAEGGCVLGQGMCVCEVCTRLVCLWWTGQHTQLLLQPCRLWNSYRETTCLSLNSLLPKFIPTHTHTLTHIFCGIGYQRWMESSFSRLGKNTLVHFRITEEWGSLLRPALWGWKDRERGIRKRARAK